MIENIALIMYLVCFVAAVLLSITGKVYLSLPILVPLIPLQNVLYRFHKYPLGKDFVDIILLAMLIGWALRSSSQGEKIIAPTMFNKLLIITGIYTFFSFIQGSFYLHTPLNLSGANVRLQTWKNYMILPLLFFITANNIKNVRQMKILMVAMFLSLLLVDLYTSRLIHFTPGLLSRDKLVGTFVYLGPNQLAAFYVHCIAMLAGIYLMHKKLLTRTGAAISIGLALFITLFLYSRGAYLAIIAVTLTIAIAKKRILILPLLVVLLTWESVLPQNVIDRIKETKTEEGTLDSSSQHRLDLWKESINLFMSNPVTGVGFDVIYQRGLIGTFKDTHNVFMKFLAEQGVVGIILLLLLFALSFKAGVMLFRTAQDTFLQGVGLGFATCVVGAFVTNLFGDRWTFMQVSSYYWVFLGLTARGLLITETEEDEYSPEYQ
jgi:O-antigen ligase